MHFIILCYFHSFFFNSSEGYGNALSFKSIDREKIKEIESKIQQNGIAIEREFDQSMEMECEVHNDNLIEMFGEHYADNPSQFRFRSGDIILIEELVARVKAIVDSDGLSRFKYDSKRKKQRPKNIKSTRIAHAQNVQNDVPLMTNQRIEMLKELLFDKVRTCFEQYSVHEYAEIGYVDLYEDRNIVDVHVRKINGIVRIYGTIACLICREQNERKTPLRVYYRGSDESSSFWVISNYTKHLTKVHHLKPIHNRMQHFDTESDLKNASENKSSDVHSESCVEIEEKIENIPTINGDTDKSNDNWLYEQLADQITKMVEANLSNGDDENQMAFQLDGRNNAMLTVASIAGDGNCLFSAIAHQLYRQPIYSNEHKDAMNRLRAMVVEHILDPVNFPSYQFALQNRVYELKSADEIQNMSTECRLYVRHVLSKDRKWGGHESIKAISEIHKVNILIFNEEGTCILQTNNNEKYEQSIAIAYRIGASQHGEIIRNHYDSVCDMNSGDVWAATDLVLKRME